jgi:hypothetical protein
MSEGGIRLGGAPSLWVEGRAEWVAVHWEEPVTNERTLLGFGVPEAIASSITGYLQELPSMSPNDAAEWVLALEQPSRALFGKRGPGDDEVTFSWQGTKDEEPVREQNVPLSELEKWPGALALFGSADPDEIRRPDLYDRN